jgi:hypothetical protein
MTPQKQPKLGAWLIGHKAQIVLCLSTIREQSVLFSRKHRKIFSILEGSAIRLQQTKQKRTMRKDLHVCGRSTKERAALLLSFAILFLDLCQAIAFSACVHHA